jgi:hypothetical protein
LLHQIIDKKYNSFLLLVYSLLPLHITYLICSNSLLVNIFAFPSFVRQEVNVSNPNENSHQWFDLKHGKYIGIIQLFPHPTQRQLQVLNNLSRLASVSYTSNGQYLNSTFWLSKPFKPSPLCSCNPSYALEIDADSNKHTGNINGIDYMAQILWNNKTNNWTYDLEEFSSTNSARVIEKIDNYTGFFTKEPVAGNSFEFNDESVYLPLNLNEIGPIIQGKAIFSISYDFKINDTSYSIGDYSKWVPIPPPRFSITILPSDLAIRPSGKQNVRVIVESNDTALSPYIDLGIEKDQGLTIENLTRLKIPFPSNGIAQFPLLVVYNGTNILYAGFDRLPISVNITYPYSAYKQIIPAAPISAHSYITLSLLPPLGIYDILTTVGSNLAQSINGIITLIIAITGGIFAILRWVVKRKGIKIVTEGKYDNPEKIYCRYCGKLRSLSANYCTFCGRSLSGNFASI